MSKVELPTITSGYNLSAINNNFQKIEDALNEEVLYRKSYVGEPNEMQTNLDMNGNKILNVITGTGQNDLATRGYVDQEIAEVGVELSTKYDKTGGPVFGAMQMQGNRITGLLPATQSSEPATYEQLLAMESGSDSLLRQELAASDGVRLVGSATYAQIRAYTGSATKIDCLGISTPLDKASGLFLLDVVDTTSPDNGGTVLVDGLGRRWKRQFSGGLIPTWFGAVPDYYLSNGITVNPTPTDSTVALQKTIDALNGNGVIDLNGFYYTTGSLNNGGILTINGDLTSNRGYDFTAKTGKHYQNGIKTSAAAMFNPNFRNAVFNITGVTLFGNGTAYNNGTNKMFNTAGKVFETDYFLVNIKYCNIQFFGDLAIDGSLGTWLWDITGNTLANNNGLAVYLNQPNNSKVEWNMFDTKNKGDLKVFRGTAFSHKKNLHNFDPSTKEYCAWFQKSNNFVSELNYFEQFGSTETVNSGKNTYPYILEIDHFENRKTRAIRNNFCQLNTTGGGLARFITLRKTDGQDFTTTANVDIVGNNLSPIPPYFMYYEPPVASAGSLILNGVSARNDLSLLLSSAAGRIFDSNRLLRTTGDGMESVYITTLTSPANNARITQSNCTEPLADASNFFTSATAWRLDPGVSGEILITYQWTSAVAANFTVNFEIVGNVFATTEVRTCTGTAGAGTFSIAKSLWGNKSLDFGFVLKGGATPLCDSFKAQIIVK